MLNLGISIKKISKCLPNDPCWVIAINMINQKLQFRDDNIETLGGIPMIMLRENG